MGAARGLLRAWPIAALTVLVIIAGCGPAQGSLLLSDESGSLDRGQLEATAAPLLARGARVALFVVASGDETGADLTRRLDGAGLLEGGEVAPDAIVIYVSNAPRYSELRAGARWSGRLPDAFLREARATALNPALRDGRPLDGALATLQAIEARLANPPLAERVWRWLGAAAAAGVALALLALSPAGPRLGRWWRASPPGRLARWLADQTPWGRRRLERVARMTRLRMEDRAAYARSWCKAASGPGAAEGAALMARLKSLDQQRAALGRGGAQGRALVEAMDKLAWAYERLGHEAARLVPARPPSKPGRKRRAASSTFTAGAAAAPGGAADSSSSETPTSWDLGGGDIGPSSDGGPW
jgi:hypothetical protein